MTDLKEDLDFEDDDFFEQYKQQRMEELSKPKKPISKQTVGYILPKGMLHDIVQIFRRDPDTQNCILDYVKSGSEINESLRQNRSDSYKKKIVCLDKGARPLEVLLPKGNNLDYVILYRAIHRPHEESKNVGFLSTSNIFVRGFGQHCMKIYVPVKTKVLVTDISEKVGLDGIYEIILPRNTNLVLFGEKENCNYYLAMPTGLVDDDVLEGIKDVIRTDLK